MDGSRISTMSLIELFFIWGDGFVDKINVNIATLE